MNKLRAGISMFLVVAGSLAAQAMAQGSAGYPKEPIRFIVAFPPGGGTDVVARIVGLHLSKSIGQPVVVENRAGASGIIAAEYVARAAPDGYTLLVGGSGPMGFYTLTYAKLPYDPVNGLIPITVLGSYPIVLTAKLDLPVKSLADLIKLAKEKPGAINYGSAGASFQVPAEYFSQRAGMKMTMIPYKGSGPAAQALMGGEIDLLVADIAPSVPLAKSGRARALAVTTATRSPVLPDVPTVAESGLPGFDVSLFSSLAAPAGTNPDIIKRLHAEVAKVLQLPEVKEKFASMGIEPGGGTPEETVARFKREIATYGPVAKAANVKVN
ncbi:MAG: tripartite tricarboxylate transporter substrate binding protein [Lacisediminimonas sp.]|nr:tripartite tricarboxylate transporter substrate binding protein [Lacisediminimonas sp.]